MRSTLSKDACVLFATGPSLTQETVDICAEYQDRVNFLGCNDSYRIVPFLDILYACDWRWWHEHNSKIHYDVPRWTCDVKAKDEFGLNWIQGARGDDLYIGPEEKIHYGWNSGFQLLNLAYRFGMRRFFLCGYNMGGDTHFFGDHPYPIRTTSPYDLFIQAFQKITVPGIVNCTVGGRLECFPRGDLREELSRL